LAAFSNYESLILVTSYGLVSYSLVCVFGSTAGRFIDGANRLQVARQFIGFENCAVLLATWLCYVLLSQQQGLERSEVDHESHNELDGIPTDPKSILLLIGIHLLGAIASLLDSGFRVAVERDWIVVMSQCAMHTTETNPTESPHQLQKEWLSDTNVSMRQIDLSCKVVAPAVAGLFVALFDDGHSDDHGYDLRVAALLVGGLNALALVVEWICTRIIYHDIPDLALKSRKEVTDTQTNGAGKEGHGQEGSDFPGRAETHSRWILGIKVPNGLHVYFQQNICWAGLSLALLYLNVVLTFGGIMTAYLVWRGMNMESIGIWRGIASAAGLAGTFVYHLMAKRTSLVNTGMISIMFQFVCLTSCYASLYIDNNSISFAMLIAGVCFSRIGLWVFDISVTQLMQENIPAPIRGLVGGVQQSLNAFFTIVAYTVGLFVSNPKYFHIYASTAFVGVALAAVFYAKNVYAKEQHLHD
jgi:iron-regulated transporter 1